MPFFFFKFCAFLSLSLFFLFIEMWFNMQYTSSFLGVHFDFFKQVYVAVSAPL